jgi:hypothetical protein
MNILVHRSMPSFNHISARPTPSSLQMAHVKNDSINTGFLSQRDLSSTAGRSFGDQRVISLDFESPLHVGTNSSTNTFTARNTATLFSETVTVKQPVEQSAFHRPLSGQENIGVNQQKPLSQNLLISQTSHYQTPQKPMHNGLMNGYQQQSSNVIIPRPSTKSDSHSCMSIILEYSICIFLF